MTAMADDGGYDPEALAGDVTDSVYKRLVYRKLAAVLLAFTGYAGYVLGDFLFGVLALWDLPQWLIGFLASFMIADVYQFAAIRARGSGERSQRGRHATEGDRMTEFFDKIQEFRRRADRPPWRKRVKSSLFWRWVAIRSVYTACSVVVLTARLGVPAGLALAAAYTVTGILVGAGAFRSAVGLVGTLAFADPRPPRDTPEI